MLLLLVSKMATSFQALSTRLTWPKRTVRKDNSSFVYFCCTWHFLSFTLTTMHCLMNPLIFCLLLTFVHVHVLHEKISVEHFNVWLCVTWSTLTCLMFARTTNIMSIYSKLPLFIFMPIFYCNFRHWFDHLGHWEPFKAIHLLKRSSQANGTACPVFFLFLSCPCYCSFSCSYSTSCSSSYSFSPVPVHFLFITC